MDMFFIGNLLNKAKQKVMLDGYQFVKGEVEKQKCVGCRIGGFSYKKSQVKFRRTIPRNKIVARKLGNVDQPPRF